MQIYRHACIFSPICGTIFIRNQLTLNKGRVFAMIMRLTYLIIGLTITGALLIISIPLLFNNPIGNTLYFIMAVLAVALIIFTISSIRARRKLDDEFNKKFH